MTEQLTDEYLAKRAEAEAVKQYPPIGNAEIDSLRMREAKACYKATLSSLKVHRDGLRVLEGLGHTRKCGIGWTSIFKAATQQQAPERPCSCGRDKQIASLRELLGVSQ